MCIEERWVVLELGRSKEYSFTNLNRRKTDWDRFFKRELQEIVERGAPPDDMDRFVGRT